MAPAFLPRRNALVALVAAYVLLLQAVLGSPALGAAADPLRFDPLGVICATHETAAGDSQNDPAHKPHLPDCCFAGCLMMGAAALAAEAAPAFRPPVRIGRLAAPTPADILPAPRYASGANPRAPPLPA
ncbi:hypothetical protein OSH08_04495 [Kaistia geumhonensis]|uniref:DUF2946 domain-containing protein n=1 Tax=Kaistia geumhonensis TaxID=410839 RepID=A0ABU0M6E0_9HYPH|nr:DUF2946 family protein [Kaistia geumhonensis]MCX5478251.1 hypothetical protein [Kaistia geumhonensis]MDQ0516532.1 hypothetical protein [Kaistia geumhonensis]